MLTFTSITILGRVFVLKKLSIIIPVYNEEEMISIFYEAFEKIKPELTDLETELWFVDDGSQDKTLIKLRELVSKHTQEVHYISFSRNFGKESALYAGLSKSTGDYTVIMDVDLQDPPELIPKMIKLMESGDYDSVATRRSDRKGERILYSFFANTFYKIINKITSLNLVPGARDFRIMNRRMTDSILLMKENQRFSKGLFNWIGFNTYYLSYENRERVGGTTSWSGIKLFNYAIEGFVAFSTFPLTLVTSVGVISFIFSCIAVIFIVIRKVFYTHVAALGWSSLMTVILFMGGIQLMSLGILGRYISESYLEVKHRPLYIVKEEK